jgi:hypothetical protein
MAWILESMRRQLPPAAATRSPSFVGCPSRSRKDNQISESSSSFEMGSDIRPPQLPANCQRGSLLPWGDRWPPCQGIGLVATNPIEQIGGGAGSSMTLA